jgi:hypothetical protein
MGEKKAVELAEKCRLWQAPVGREGSQRASPRWNIVACTTSMQEISSTGKRKYFPNPHRRDVPFECTHAGPL